jgi:hypothetical protein
VKYLLPLLFAGCASYPIKYTGIVHDYVFENSKKLCANNGGLHYIVSSETIYEKGKREEYPCEDVYRVRCQDGSLKYFYDGVKYCFISKSQLEETLRDEIK